VAAPDETLEASSTSTVRRVSVWLHHKAAVPKVRERIEEHGPI
jgi:hypothetical protein